MKKYKKNERSSQIYLYVFKRLLIKKITLEFKKKKTNDVEKIEMVIVPLVKFTLFIYFMHSLKIGLDSPAELR